MNTGARLLSAALALAVAVAAGVLAWLLLVDDDAAGRPVGNTPAAGGAVVASSEAKATALEAAERATTRVLSYSHRSLADDVDRSRVLLAGEMLEQYDDTMRRIGPETLRTRRVVRATVVGSSVIAATERDAKALLFVNTETRRQGRPTPRVELTRVVVTLRQHDDGWRVTALDSL